MDIKVRKFLLTYTYRSLDDGQIVKENQTIVAAAPNAEAAIAMRNPKCCFDIKAEEIDSSTPHQLETLKIVDEPKRPEGFQGQWIGGRYFSWERLMSE